MSPGCVMFLIKEAKTRWNTNIPRDTESPLKAFTHKIYTVRTNANEPVMTCVWNRRHILHNNINNDRLALSIAKLVGCLLRRLLY